MPTFPQTQQLFWKLISAPEGVAPGLAALSPSERGMADTLVRRNARLSAVEQLDIYADMYFYRIRDCLMEDFAALHAVIGAAAFHNLITDYLLVHPSTHFSLRHVGRHLPAYVGTHALGEQYPYLADLAALEWTILESFDAPDAAPLDAAALGAVPEECWPDLRFTLTPSLHVLELGWPVHEIWRQAQAGDRPFSEPAETYLRVWRQNLRVFHRPVDAAEYAALTAIRAGETFSEVCESIAAVVGEDEGPERAATLLQEWLADALLTGCSASV
jgi:Putative DNA-binding domain